MASNSCRNLTAAVLFQILFYSIDPSGQSSNEILSINFDMCKLILSILIGWSECFNNSEYSKLKNHTLTLTICLSHLTKNCTVLLLFIYNKQQQALPKLEI